MKDIWLDFKRFKRAYYWAPFKTSIPEVEPTIDPKTFKVKRFLKEFLSLKRFIGEFHEQQAIRETHWDHRIIDYDKAL